jgi:hypothetical protein
VTSKEIRTIRKEGRYHQLYILQLTPTSYSLLQKALIMISLTLHSHSNQGFHSQPRTCFTPRAWRDLFLQQLFIQPACTAQSVANSPSTPLLQRMPTPARLPIRIVRSGYCLKSPKGIFRFLAIYGFAHQPRDTLQSEREGSHDDYWRLPRTSAISAIPFVSLLNFNGSIRASHT